jgi:hypothetical protein
MMRIEWVAFAAVGLVIGCASTRREEAVARPASVAHSSAHPVEADPPASGVRARLEVDPEMPADELGRAFVWGDVSPPPSSRRATIRTDGATVDGYLVGAAQEVDMGKLAPDIHDVVMVGCEKDRLVGSHPSSPEHFPIELDASATPDGARAAHDIFAFVSVEPGDVADEARARDVLALLGRLPSRVRYAVMGLSE